MEQEYVNPLKKKRNTRSYKSDTKVLKIDIHKKEHEIKVLEDKLTLRDEALKKAYTLLLGTLLSALLIIVALVTGK